MKLRKISPEEEQAILDRLAYNPETGSFWVREIIQGSCKEVGDAIGQIKTGGYVYICMSKYGPAIPAHRIAWFIMTGSWPKDELDHINRVRSDNRFCNLRECNHSENSQNRGVQKNNRSGVKGVNWNKSKNKWHAKFMINSKRIDCGLFNSIEAAAKAIKTKRESLSNGFTNHGAPQP